MTNLHNDRQNNLVSFLRHHQPLPPDASVDLEQLLIDSLEPHPRQRRLSLNFKKFKTVWTISRGIVFRVPTKLIATGFLFTSVSFGVKTPRIALEPKDLDNFLVKNWHDTLDSNIYSYAAGEKPEAYWLLPTVSEPQPALSFAAQ
jgi:hypothetical protein